MARQTVEHPRSEAAARAADRGEGGDAISLRGLRRDYGDRTVLAGVSLDLPPGGTLAVIGPNGAGKTTLLRILGSLLRPTAGEVAVLGCSLPAEAWRLRGRVGWLGHAALLYRDLSVAENLRFQARLHRLDRTEAEERIAELLSAVRLERRGGELVRNLSAGMAQRAAVCRAVLHRPELLLLDEPFAHLDPGAGALIEPLLGAGAGLTRVLVSHDLEAALVEGDRLLALGAGGSVAYEGPAAGLGAGEARSLFGGAA